MDQLHIEEAVEFSDAKRIRKKLFGSQRIVAELLCYEPGQATPIHHHPQQDEMFYVLEGTGKMVTAHEGAEEQTNLTPKSLTLVTAGTRHGLTADSRMVILFFKSPASPGTAMATA